MADDEILDYDVGDDSPAADIAATMTAVAQALATSSTDLVNPGHVHEANARVWAQLFDPRWVDDAQSGLNTELRPGDLWVVMDYQSYQLNGLGGTTPVIKLYDGAQWQVTGTAGTTPPVLSYTHTQNTPATVWTVQHNMGYNPSVSVVDTAGSIIIPGVVHMDANTITLNFAGATAGKAYCS